MNWTTKSPGIDVCEWEGWVITRISEKMVPGRIGRNGQRQQLQICNYVAAKPYTTDVFRGQDIDRIKEKILATQVKTLF